MKVKANFKRSEAITAVRVLIHLGSLLKDVFKITMNELDGKKTYYERNKKKMVKQHADYYKKNSTKIKKRLKKYYKANREERKKKSLAYYYANLEKCRKAQKAYYQASKGAKCE